MIRLLGMFVSAWRKDNHGIRKVNLNDLKDRFLKEAENGNVDALKSMLKEYPGLLSVR